MKKKQDQFARSIDENVDVKLVLEALTESYDQAQAHHPDKVTLTLGLKGGITLPEVKAILNLFDFDEDENPVSANVTMTVTHRKEGNPSLYGTALQPSLPMDPMEVTTRLEERDGQIVSIHSDGIEHGMNTEVGDVSPPEEEEDWREWMDKTFKPDAENETLGESQSIK